MSTNSSGTARVTLEDAARLLGIQNASVKKRIQRGKLASEEDAQGQSFVYLPLDEIVQDGSTSRRGRTSPARGDPSGWKTILERFGGVSAFVAAAAAGVYVLGLVALWGPIARTYTHDYSASWYAVSLIPRNVVVGHGIKPVWVPTVLLVVVISLHAMVNYEKWVGKAGLTGPTKFAAYAALPLAFIGLMALMASTVFIIRAPATPTFLGSGLWVYLLMIYPAVLLVRVFRKGLDISGEHLLPRVKDRRLVRGAFGGYFVFVFVTGFLWLLFFTQPPLATIEVTANKEITESGARTLNGALLAHTDSFWYVFNKNGGNLLAIPDDSVNRVGILPQKRDEHRPLAKPRAYKRQAMTG